MIKLSLSVSECTLNQAKLHLLNRVSGVRLFIWHMWPQINLINHWNTNLWHLLWQQLRRWHNLMLNLTPTLTLILILTLPWTKSQMITIALNLCRRRYLRRSNCHRSKCQITWKTLSGDHLPKNNSRNLIQVSDTRIHLNLLASNSVTDYDYKQEHFCCVKTHTNRNVVRW